jgi:E3 SUMO-protein ligase RanBP2
VIKDLRPSVKGTSSENKTVARKLFDEGADNECVILYEAHVTDEEREAALRLQLPPNFYAYRNAPKCPGCVGCEADSGDENVVKQSSLAGAGDTNNIFSTEQDTTTGFSQKTPLFTSNTDSPITKSIFNTPSLFGNSGDVSKTGFLFGSSSSGGGFTFGNPQQASSTTTSIFGKQETKEKEEETVTSTTEPNKPAPFSFGNFNSCVTFASLKDKPIGIKVDPEKSVPWELKGAPVFGGKKTEEGEVSGSSDNEGGDGEHNLSAHDPHFAPIVPLPDQIEVRTGEEEEEKVFCERAKLFRYDASTKEWKERGVGEMKILYHPVNCTYRFLLRREQVHKVVCNHLLTCSIVLEPLSSSDKAWCWGTMNYAEEVGVVEELAARFKTTEIAERFKEKVLECQEKLKLKPLLPVSVVEQGGVQYDYEDDDDDEDDEDEEDDDDEDEDDYVIVDDDDENAVIVLEKSGFILYEYIHSRDEYQVFGQNPFLQVSNNKE